MSESHDFVRGRKDLARFLLHYIVDACPDATLAIALLRTALVHELDVDLPLPSSHDIAADAYRSNR